MVEPKPRTQGPLHAARIEAYCIIGDTARRRRWSRGTGRYRGSVCERGVALAYDTEGSDVPTVRRRCRSGDDVASGEDRWTAQLGLSLLLAARYSIHSVGIDAGGFCRRGSGVAAAAAGYGCGNARPLIGQTGKAARQQLVRKDSLFCLWLTNIHLFTIKQRAVLNFSTLIRGLGQRE